MTRAAITADLDFHPEKVQYLAYLRYLLFGLLLPLGFAPFHMPGLAIIGMALFYRALTALTLSANTQNTPAPFKSTFLSGLLFGLGFFGLGTSWVYISIHEYGHLHGLVAGGITLLFLLYLSLFPALVASIFSRLQTQQIASKPLYSGLLFSALWTLGEFARANLLSGFPWVLLGTGQFDTPLKFLFPLIGVFGVSFVSCFAATLLSNGLQIKGFRGRMYLLAFIGLILLPLLLKQVSWSEIEDKPISTSIIQANLSMRDKWDDKLFWDLLDFYEKKTEKLLGSQLIVMPESAIPLPGVYISDFLNQLDEKGKKAGSAILLGIPHPADLEERNYFNTLLGIGTAKGSYFKQHLVPFGEYIPGSLQAIINWLEFPDTNLIPGKKNQALIQVQNHSIASLICYELAYGSILRQQLPLAEWIVSISDDGWFGHSLAMYQQLQIAQVLAIEAGRYHVVSNNDGLSSIIDTKGKITASLPAFTGGVLQSQIFAATGQTPWVRWGDMPVLVGLLVLIAWIMSIRFKTKFKT
jgi:apolipoprotein N-acyltransferase